MCDQRGQSPDPIHRARATQLDAAVMDHLAGFSSSSSRARQSRSKLRTPAESIARPATAFASAAVPPRIRITPSSTSIRSTTARETARSLRRHVGALCERLRCRRRYATQGTRSPVCSPARSTRPTRRRRATSQSSLPAFGDFTSFWSPPPSNGVLRGGPILSYVRVDQFKRGGSPL